MTGEKSVSLALVQMSSTAWGGVRLGRKRNTGFDIVVLDLLEGFRPVAGAADTGLGGPPPVT